MSKISKRISSFVLTIAMILTMIPMAASIAFADEEPAVPTTVLTRSIDNDPELVEHLVISAPGMLWNISKASYDGNYDISQTIDSNVRYLTLGEDDLSSGSKTSYGLHINFDESGMAIICQYTGSWMFERYYRGLTGSFKRSDAQTSTEFEPFGYLFTSDGEWVTTSDGIEGGDYYIVSTDLAKCLTTDKNGKYYSVSRDFKLFAEIENNYQIAEDPEYNGNNQEIFNFGAGLLSVSGVSGDAFVSGSAVYAKNQGEYEITLRPAAGNYWPDWTADEKVLTASIVPKTEYVVYVESSAPKTYALTVDAENGTYTQQTKKYAAGDSVKISYAANDGYGYYGCAVCTAKTLTEVPYTDEDGVLSFVMPKEAVNVTLYFVEEEAVDVLADFTDLKADAWYIDAVRYCVEHGYADGTSKTTFEPNRVITKAEALGMIWKFAGRLYPNYAYRYKDVSEGKWFTPAVRWGAAEKVVSDEMEYFLPSTPAQHQIVAVMFYQYLQTKGEGFGGLWMYKLSAPDADQVASWALEAVTYLNMISVMQGDEKGNLKPEALMTRAEMCEVIYKYDTLADEF